MMCMKTVKSKLTLSALSVMALGMLVITSCSKSSSNSGGTPPPVLIGGYASSDSVASGNLVAYWPFDGNATETKANLTATVSGNITYATGVRGQAYQGSAGAYATYTASPAFNALASYSLSFWYKIPSAQTSGTQGLFFVTGTTTQDLLINEIESYTPVSGDSVRIHTGFNDLASPAYQLFVPETYDTNAVGKWVHFAVTYNGSTSVYTVYQDGNPSGTSTAFSNGMYVTPNTLYTDGTKATPLGNLGFASDPAKGIVIGSWPDGLFGQSAAADSYLGQLDELRVFNKALTQQEVAGLFLNGQAGR